MISENSNICTNCPCRWRNFDSLTEEEMTLVNNNRTEAKFKAGEIIFKQGSPTSNAIFISSGIGKIFMEGYDGKNIILSLITPGWLIAGPGTYVDNRHHYSFAALTDVSACFVDINIIKELVHKNSEFAEGYIKDLSYKSLNTYNKLASLTQKKMHGRLAEGILYLAEKIYKSNSFNCILSRQELGELTDMTKESVVRLLKEFNEDDIVRVKNTQMEILNMEKLKKIKVSG